MDDPFARQLDLPQLVSDTRTIAGMVGVAPTDDHIQRLLEAYQPHFVGGAVGMRTTNKPVQQRELSLRYMDPMTPHDPYAIALEHGLLARDDHPIHAFMTETQATLPVMGYGIDAGVSHGFEKIWPLFGEAVPMERIYAMKSVPPAVQRYDEHFKTYDFTLCSLFAVDFWNKSMNVYFMFRERDKYPPERTVQMIRDLGLTLPADERELDINALALTIYYTFTWESQKVERLCFGVAHAPGDAAHVRIDPLFARLADDAPSPVPDLKHAIGTTYTPDNRNYLKIELDYSGKLFYALTGALNALP